MGIMIDPSFKNRAINIFAYSKTVRTELGQAVHRYLHSAADGIFQWLPLPRDVEAVSHRRFDQVIPSAKFSDALKELVGVVIPLPVIMSINDRFKGDLVLTSLQLVHETVHHLKWKECKVEQELHAYRFTSEYYKELRQGVFVASEEKRYRLAQVYAPQEEAINKLRTGKLVDWLVAQNGVDDMSSDWVLGHISYWGGLKARELNTKIAYSNVIVRDSAATFKAQDVYLDLIESMAKKDRSMLRNAPRHKAWIEMIVKRYADVRRRKRFQAIADEIGLKL